MERVIAYVDGFNLYYGLRDKGWRKFYWLNIQALVQNLLKPHQTLSITRYFTTIVKYPKSRHRRQARFLDALRTLSDFEIYYGHFLSERITCRQCGHQYFTHHEKMTDVNIAVELMKDAFQDQLDTGLLVSGDGDLVGPIRATKELFPEKKIIIVSPPKRVSNALISVAHGHTRIGRNLLAKSQFPDKIAKSDGYVLNRPAQWR
jgi:uncharacterized LabA/DUF88 family protein